MTRMLKKLLMFGAFIAPIGARILTIHTPIGELSLFRLTVFLALLLRLSTKHWIITYATSKNNRYSTNYMLAFVIYALLSVGWAKDTSSWFRNFFFLAFAYVTVVLYTDLYRSTDSILPVMKCFFGGVMIQAILGCYEVVSKTYIFKSDARYSSLIQFIGVPVAMQNNPNNFALLMFVGICISSICCLYTRRKMIYVLGIVFFLAMIALSVSRSVIIGVFIALLFLVLLSHNWKIKGIVFGLLICALFIPEVIDYIRSALQFNFSSDRSSDVIRNNLIKNGLVFLVETYGFGVGAGQIGIWIEENAVYTTLGTLAMHNYWIELLSSYGIVMFIGFLVFYVKLFKNHLRAYRTVHEKSSLMICMAMAGFIVALIGPSSALVIEWLWFFWGICIALQH